MDLFGRYPSAANNVVQSIVFSLHLAHLAPLECHYNTGTCVNFPFLNLISLFNYCVATM